MCSKSERPFSICLVPEGGVREFICRANCDAGFSCVGGSWRVCVMTRSCIISGSRLELRASPGHGAIVHVDATDGCTARHERAPDIAIFRDRTTDRGGELFTSGWESSRSGSVGEPEEPAMTAGICRRCAEDAALLRQIQPILRGRGWRD